MPHLPANLKRRLSELLDVTLTAPGWLHWDGSLATAQTPTAADVGADATGTAAGLVSAEASARAGADTTEATARAGVQTNLTTHAALTTGAHGGLVADTDARLTNARTPTAHAASHAPGGSDDLYGWFGLLTAARLEPYPYLLAESSSTLASGTVQYTYFTAPWALTIANLLILSGTVTAAAISLCRLGLYTVDAGTGALTLVARTASDTAVLSSPSTLYTRALDTTGGYPSSYPLVRGTRYAFGVVAVFTSTAPTVRGRSLTAAHTGLPPFLARGHSGQTDLPTGDTTAGTFASGIVPWMGAT